jgi:hypothetical protein
LRHSTGLRGIRHALSGLGQFGNWGRARRGLRDRRRADIRGHGKDCLRLCFRWNHGQDNSVDHRFKDRVQGFQDRTGQGNNSPHRPVHNTHGRIRHGRYLSRGHNLADRRNGLHNILGQAGDLLRGRAEGRRDK